MAISAAIKILQPEPSKDYKIQIMVKNVIDGSENYISIQDKQMAAADNSGWITIETFFTKQTGDQEAYIQVLLLFINIYAGGLFM